MFIAHINICLILDPQAERCDLNLRMHSLHTPSLTILTHFRHQVYFLFCLGLRLKLCMTCSTFDLNHSYSTYSSCEPSLFCPKRPADFPDTEVNRNRFPPKSWHISPKFPLEIWQVSQEAAPILPKIRTWFTRNPFWIFRMYPLPKPQCACTSLSTQKCTTRRTGSYHPRRS